MRFTAFALISIHSLRMEGDIRTHGRQTKATHFNPLPPHGGRRGEEFVYLRRYKISIHSLRMEGDRVSTHSFDLYKISIHSLRMEGD